MSAMEDRRNKGMEMPKEVALRYASQHGLRPDTVEWACQRDDEW